MWQEFREFLKRGNVLDLAIAVVLGGAFGAIVTSLVNDILMPIVGILLGGVDFSSLSITVGESVIAYGNFIQAIVNFIIIAASIFVAVKAYSRLQHEEESAPEPEPEPELSAEVKLLTEIRDLLKERN